TRRGFADRPCLRPGGPRHPRKKGTPTPATRFLLTDQHELSIIACHKEDRLMRELTSRQQEVLSFMRSFQARHGVPPTVREIGERFRITPRAAFDHLRALERKGELQRRPSVGRTS